MPLSKLVQRSKAFRENPKFILMRSMARFRSLRRMVRAARQYSQRSEWVAYKQALRARLSESVFSTLDPDVFVADLKKNGMAFGLTLPPLMLHDILNYTKAAPCYADREIDKGFVAEERVKAEGELGKSILVAQYFNSEKGCGVIEKLRNDPFLLLVAAEYLGSISTHVGTNLWWTFPVNASLEDRSRHAHVFHRDVDDFAFFKYFFYLTNVDEGDGAHVCVSGSHLRPPVTRPSDRLLIRRWSDQEISKFYADRNILVINGVAGTGFAEDTLCIHKGSTPILRPRLLLQIEYALFDYGVQSDLVPADSLKQIT